MELYLKRRTWGGSGGTRSRRGETAAASDPEDGKEAKYGRLPEQMLSLLGNHFEASWKSWRAKGWGKAQRMSDLQESRSPWAGRSNSGLPVLPGGTCFLICDHTRDEVVHGCWGQGVWILQSRSTMHYKKWVEKIIGNIKELQHSSSFVNLHMWSTFWGWSEDPQWDLCG